MKISVIIQARMGSSRLPRKILKNLNNQPAIIYMYNRLKKSKKINDIIICTSTNREDDKLCELLKENNIKFYRGSEEDVLDRYYQTALISDTDIIIRCTGDCPLIDYKIIDDMIEKFKKNEEKYYVMEYKLNSSFPDGFAFEIFTFDVLEEAYKNTKDEHDIEHVTPYIVRKYENKLNYYKIYDTDLKKFKDIYKNINFNNLHLSIDTLQDFELIKNIVNNFKDKEYELKDVLEYINNNSNLLCNKKKISNFNGKGQELYKEAKKIIPGGTQLLSKRPEMFLPEYWPSYYQKASGIEITTLDGIKMKDFSYMGIGSCILGYKDKDVNLAVHTAIDRGNMSTLNCPNEVKLTKLLCEIHPWADMARYTRSGGEACSVAVRIGRTASKKDKIAFCGYHGWHDWYLAANWNKGDDLDSHLIKGLSPNGVPKNLKNTAFPFNYNKIEELYKILENHDIGTIIMETQRSEPPKDNFLRKIRKICNEKNIILIFDEVSSGFRLNSGGLHLLYDINPDIAIFAKAISNGYPMGAIIGKKEVMNCAQDTFISSTYWTEDIGFTAAIATIEKHQRLDVGNHIKELGEYFQKKLKVISNEVGINLIISGLPCFSTFVFDYKNSMEIKTLYIQMMLERDIIAKNCLYLSYAHKKDDIDFYLENIKDIFMKLKKIIDNDEVLQKLKGTVTHCGFKRLS